MEKQRVCNRLVLAVVGVRVFLMKVAESHFGVLAAMV
ncbi:hypothetical protein GGE48_006633 [Rhizobium leguminosarum]|nr:hypothetical protein [Rhizobium leguminosarum]